MLPPDFHRGAQNVEHITIATAGVNYQTLLYLELMQEPDSTFIRSNARALP